MLNESTQAFLFFILFANYLIKTPAVLFDERDIYIVYNKPSSGVIQYFAKYLSLLLVSTLYILVVLAPAALHVLFFKNAFYADIVRLFGILVNLYLFICFYLFAIYTSFLIIPARYCQSWIVFVSTVFLSMSSLNYFTDNSIMLLQGINVMYKSAGILFFSLPLLIFHRAFERKYFDTLLHLSRVGYRSLHKRGRKRNVIMADFFKADNLKYGFILALKETSYSKQFLSNALVGIINVLVIAFTFFKNHDYPQSFKQYMHMAVVMYISLPSLLYILTFAKCSNNFHAGWIFKIAPKKNRPMINIGIFVAVYSFYCLTTQLIISILSLYFWGGIMIMDLLLYNFLVFVTCASWFVITSRNIAPFSVDFKQLLSIRTFAYIFLSLIFCMVFSIAHTYILHS